MTSDSCKPYGQECIVDVHNCRFDFTRLTIEQFCAELAEILDMEREELVFWDFEDCPEEYEKTPPHLRGISAVQFIKTSNITIHTLDELERVYLNVFSCKPFDSAKVRKFVQGWTNGTIVNFLEITRI